MYMLVSFKGLLVRSDKNVNVCVKCLCSFGGESDRHACYLVSSDGCDFSADLQCQRAKRTQEW